MNNLITVIVLVAAACCAEGIDQDSLDYIGNNLGVQYNVIDNFVETELFRAQIILTNNGANPIAQDAWEIYFYSLYLIEPAHLNDSDCYELPSSDMEVCHVNGILFKLQPTSNFNGIQNGTSLSLDMIVNYWSVSRTDTMPRWYVAAANLNPVLIKSTESLDLDFVGNFDAENKYKRYTSDKYHPYSAEDRYNKYKDYDSSMTPSPILPTPVILSVDESQKVNIQTWKVYCENYEKECKYLRDHFSLEALDDGNPPQSTNNIIEVVYGNVDIDGSLVENESYKLEVRNNKITITAPSSSGAFYAIQSLIALSSSSSMIPLANITDAPRYQYRGMHLDVGRNFVSKDEVIKILKVMAMYKLNNFHFHLTDDEGWRLEIESYPELTSVGSKRAHDPSETTSIIPQLGSGPNDDTSGSGFYTKNDYQDILRFAEDHHIRVIPEIDLPGHAHAAIKSNLAYYRRLLLDGMNEADAAKELISDLDDRSKYLSVQMFTDNAVNPCIEGTYTFIENVVKDIIEMHRGIQNLSVFHLGGDEIAEAWSSSPKCEELFKKGGFPANVSDLLEYFMRRAIFKAVNASDDDIQIGVWEDGAMDHDEIPYVKDDLTDADVIAYAWQNVWEWGDPAQRPYKLANAGYKVVMSQATHLYMDQPNEPDPEERGLYWASRFTDSIKTFSFRPDDVYANSDYTRAGDEYPESMLCPNDSCTKLEKQENILGMQGQLFSETVRNVENLHYMVFPRLLALAERAWHKASWESIKGNSEEHENDWARFAATLGQRELSRLDDLGISYRIPLPGVLLSDNKALTNCEFPGLKIRYQEGNSWTEIPCGDEIPLSKDGGKIVFQTKSASNTPRYSRSVLVEYNSVITLHFNLITLALCLVAALLFLFV